MKKTENGSQLSNLGKPSFWSYVITNRSYNLYSGKDQETYYTAKRRKVLKIVLVSMPVLFMVCFWLSILISGIDSWNYSFDAFALLMILLPLIALLDYKSTKFEPANMFGVEQEEISRMKSNKSINLVFVTLIPVFFIFAFLNSFSFNWIRSQTDESKDVYLSAFEIGEYEMEFDKGSDSKTISISEVYLESESVRIDIVSEKTPEPIELILNGIVYNEENMYIRKSINFFWKETYFFKRSSIYLDIENLENKNRIEIKCGDIEKEYTLVIDKFKLAYTILDDGRIVLRGHSIGDSMEQVILSEGAEPKRVYQDTLNKNATKLDYEGLRFFRYGSDITYVFEDDKLYKVIVSSGAFSPFQEESDEEKFNEVVKQLEVFGEPDVIKRAGFSDGFVAEWQGEEYHIFLLVHSSGFSFVAEQTSSDIE